jgi:hypothetical protein
MDVETVNEGDCVLETVNDDTVLEDENPTEDVKVSEKVRLVDFVSDSDSLFIKEEVLE